LRPSILRGFDRRERERAGIGARHSEEIAMRKIVVGAFVSLDGVMQAPGGPEEDPTGGFGFGGWATKHSHDRSQALFHGK
jgi:hypothetical protein